jgi:hypothetical protein
MVFLGGTPPRPPWVGFAEVWANKPSAKQNKRFLLLFLEKEEISNSKDAVLALVDTSGFAKESFC